MKQQLLIDDDLHAVRAAIVEDERLVEIWIEPADSPVRVGDVFKGRVSRVAPGLHAAFVDIGVDRDAFLFVDDLAETNRPPASPVRIEEVLHKGREVVVQVVKEAVRGKGPRITTRLSLPGRFLVLLIGSTQLAVSRRIEDPEERERLLELLEGLEPPAATGLIARTVAEGAEAAPLRSDLAALADRWRQIEERAASATAPVRLYRDLAPVLRAVRDRADPSIEAVWVSGSGAYEAVRRFFDDHAAAAVPAVRLHEGPGELFEQFGVEAQIAAALEPRVPLPSGGQLVIQPTEALVAIDVNTAKDLGGADLEETILRTNLEAAAEVARQLRLRDLSGIIVVDFIDMEDAGNREAVFGRLEEALVRDPARAEALAVSDFGLVEITRRRDRTNLLGRLTRPCPACEGRGYVLAECGVLAAARRAVRRLSVARPGASCRLAVHPEVHAALQADRSGWVESLVEAAGGHLDIVAESGLPRGEFRLVEEAL